MSLVNYTNKEINIKIVYYGPGLSGKTTNIQYIHRKLNPKQRGKLLSLATEADRTLFFDFLPISLGDIKGFSTRFHVYTVPGQVHYNETRRMVLKGVDGIVFVADSQLQMMEDNLESLRNLYDNLKDLGKDLKEMPFVLQYNKRDLENVVAVQDLDRSLNNLGVPAHDAVALSGKGVLETFTEISKLALKRVREKPTLLNEERADENELLTKFMQGEGTEEVDRPRKTLESVEAPENVVVSPEGLLTPHERMETPSENDSEENPAFQEQPQPSATLQPMTKEAVLDSATDTLRERSSEVEGVRSPEEMLIPAEDLAEEDATERGDFMETPKESDLSEPSIPEESRQDIETKSPATCEMESEDIASLAEVMKMADEEPLGEIHEKEALSPEEIEDVEEEPVISDDLAYEISEEELSEGESLFDPKDILEEGEETEEEEEISSLDTTVVEEGFEETTLVTESELVPEPAEEPLFNPKEIMEEGEAAEEEEEASGLETEAVEETEEETAGEPFLETESELSLEETGEVEAIVRDDITDEIEEEDLSEEEPLFNPKEIMEEGEEAIVEEGEEETASFETEAEEVEDAVVISDDLADEIDEGDLSEEEPLFNPKEIMEEGEEAIEEEEAAGFAVEVMDEREEALFHGRPLFDSEELPTSLQFEDEEETTDELNLTSEKEPEEEPLSEAKKMTEEGEEMVDVVRDGTNSRLEIEAVQERSEEAAEEMPFETESELSLEEPEDGGETVSQESEEVDRGIQDYEIDEPSEDLEQEKKEALEETVLSAASESEKASVVEETTEEKSVETPLSMSIDPGDIDNVTVGSPESKGDGKFIIPLVISGEAGSRELKLNLLVNNKDVTIDKIEASVATDLGTGASGTETAESIVNDFLSEKIDFDENIDASFLDELDELDDASTDESPHGKEEGEDMEVIEKKKEKKGFFISLFGGRHSAKH
ncbi:MAG: GTPase domain-containing protein [Proteobacteria bacterium]|nr:GTPase domain-containing protein [Pseudomonadota bacterium]